MPFKLGIPELVIILVIVLVLFGTSRITRIGKDLGTAISEFRKGMTTGEDENKKKEEETPKEQ